jgi:hypothetical protein
MGGKTMWQIPQSIMISDADFCHLAHHRSG